MHRRMSMTVMTAAALTAAAAVLAPAAQAAPKKPGLYGPSEVTVGQEVTYTSVFKAAPKKANGCFTPEFTFSDETSSGVGVWTCLNALQGGSAAKKSPRPATQVDEETHVFTQPGTYTVTVEAGALLSTSGVSNPKAAIVKGPKSYSMTVNVLPAQ